MQKVFGSAKKLGSFYLYSDSQGKWAIRFGVQFDAADLPAGLESGSPGIKALEDTIRFVERVGEETDAMLNGDVDNR